MNHVVKHIDPREILEELPVDDYRKMSKMMKSNGNTPYRYIRRAFKCLGNEDYETAADWITYAGKFINIYYRKNSKANENFKLTVETLRIQFDFLRKQFMQLHPDKD